MLRAYLIKLINIYCTNARIDKWIHKLLDMDNALDRTLMHKLPNAVVEDIAREQAKEFMFKPWVLDLKQLRSKISKRCLGALDLMIRQEEFIDNKEE